MADDAGCGRSGEERPSRAVTARTSHRAHRPQLPSPANRWLAFARGRHVLSTALGACLLVGACGPTVPPTPSSTPPASPAATETPAPSATPVASHATDGHVEPAGLRHDSRDTLYRTPGGAVPAGTPVTIRLRTFHDDVTAARLRVYSVDEAAQEVVEMGVEAAHIGCYQADLADETCDFWAATLDDAAPDNLWYRFIVSDGDDTAYYADDTPALDGGLGAATAEPVDDSYALTVYEPAFAAPDWARDAVVYQIFADRFRNGDPANDPATGDVLYDHTALQLDWGTPPEGYCRAYADATASCPWRYEGNPPEWSPTIEGPRGRDYFGGDLRGVIDELDYLAGLGVSAIYFNPIFDSRSNHGYDTRDYTTINPYFGSEADFEELVAKAGERGIRIILDGVFNHMSSDSPFFDRYGHYESDGACESVDSPWRSWFMFHVAPGGGPCAAPGGPGRMVYDSWFGFDTIPTINKTREEVLDYFVTGAGSIARLWLERGAAGWRMDVSGDPSFPAGYWEAFREMVKAQDPDALTISETWQKDGALLRAVRGDRFDTTMNYRLRDAVLGLLAPTAWDAKGFPDSGGTLSPSQVAQRLLSIQEDYPPAAYFSLMNLLDSHDTARLLWALTPGPVTQAGREENAANVAEGKARQRLAALLQFSLPGMPTIYYGDEVGLTGNDDPDDRRTYPWADLGGQSDEELYSYYAALAATRRDQPVLRDGDLRLLLADDDAGVLALGRRTGDQAAVVVINRSDQAQAISIPVAGFVPDNAVFVSQPGRPPDPEWGTQILPVSEGRVELSLPALDGLILVTGFSEPAPAAPAGLTVTDENDGSVSLSWHPVAGAAGYAVYRSPLSGGGWTAVTDAALTTTSFSDQGLSNGRTYHYAVTALSGAGNESAYSNEVPAWRTSC
jgi:glycosidase